MSEISEVIVSEIADFFAGFGGPGEPDIQNGEAQRLLTERVLSVLALRERAEPVAVLDIQSGRQDGNKFALVFTRATHTLPDDVYNLYTAPPAPVEHEDDSEIKWRELALQFDGHRMQAICFLKQILNELPEAEFSSARDFLKAGPLPGEEVLRNRIAALAPPAPVVPDALEQFAEFMAAESIKAGDYPDGWKCKAANAAHEYAQACRAAMLEAPATN